MAVYKVPQDVEADDKLIGPFSFRQFIYLIIAVISIAIGWGLSQLFIPLAIIPLPLIIFFGALALPLRKDQPMEIYLAAVVSFYLKPRKRLWQPDGIQSLVEITAPKEIEVQRAKDLSQMEAQQRLSYLADIVDTGGWSVRGVGMPVTDSAMQNDAYYEAQQAVDILDSSAGVSQSFDTMISQSDAKRRQEMVERMHQAPEPVAAPPRITPPPIADPYAALTPTPAVDTSNDPHVTFNPYPNSIHQSVIVPLSEQLPQPAVAAPPTTVAPVEPAIPAPSVPETTSERPVSPDIINLANNSDLSIETIAHEANRIHQKEEEKLPEDEVVISLR
ncbi:MAG: PrgI family protein [Candidatus Saccharibacteria bacterium]|nr:MAG: PrgI family protein [Candidatus Saccharibacteria bacterium]